jgi:dihydropteroate synthase
MGVLNVTPDSFSDGGQHDTVEAAVAHAERLRAEGADVIDVGGATTRPGAEPVPVVVELARVIPVIEALHARGLGPLSIDTTSAEVADRALAAGAHLVNDISAGTFEPELLAVVARHRVPVVLMHTRGRPKDMQLGTWTYRGGVVAAVREALEEACARAQAAGIAREDIVIDPGIGFGKTVDENLELLAGLTALGGLGQPILVGTSRKSFLGALTGRPVGERVFATAATVAHAVAQGVAIVRVHDVAPMVDVVKVAHALRGRRSDV